MLHPKSEQLGECAHRGWIEQGSTSDQFRYISGVRTVRRSKRSPIVCYPWLPLEIPFEALREVIVGFHANAQMVTQLVQLYRDGKIGKPALFYSTCHPSRYEVQAHAADDKYLTGSPVSEAVHGGHFALASVFIDRGAKCSLHHAVQCNHLAKARQLLSEGTDVREKDDCYLGSPMAVAIWNDSVEMVQLLMEFGASPNEQEPIHQGRDGVFGGDTPLHDAVHKGSAKMVKLLLAHGADPDIQNAYRLSPVELAKRRDQTHLVNLMEKQIDRSVIGESVEQLLTIGKVSIIE